jgi:arylsulfatase A-like enzyme
MDMALRVDQQIAALLDFIDARVGLDQTIVALSSDHGAAPIPEMAVRHHLPARRQAKAELLKVVQAGLQAKYARPGRPATDYIQKFANKAETEIGIINNNFYLNQAALARDGIDPQECERVIGEAATKLPGVIRYFTRQQLEKGLPAGSDVIARQVRRGFYPQRSGDVIVVAAPYTIIFDVPEDATDPRSTASHGSPYSYDTHVPLIIMGKGIRAGRYKQAATPADLAPTLARLLRIKSPDCAEGRTLVEGLTASGRSRAPRGN